MTLKLNLLRFASKFLNFFINIKGVEWPQDSEKTLDESFHQSKMPSSVFLES